ncbi:MAG: hypothetical protein MJE77_18615 [Proteobacteria bacterium]|nr:hypothetical protein [Pseudomonadota bacterium]
MRIVATGKHPADRVDPFGRLPCRHRTVLVHITDRESMGDDLVECRRCGYAMRLADLYEGLFPKNGSLPGAPAMMPGIPTELGPVPEQMKAPPSEGDSPSSPRKRRGKASREDSAKDSD